MDPTTRAAKRQQLIELKEKQLEYRRLVNSTTDKAIADIDLVRQALINQLQNVENKRVQLDSDDIEGSNEVDVSIKTINKVVDQMRHLMDPGYVDEHIDDPNYQNRGVMAKITETEEGEKLGRTYDIAVNPLTGSIYATEPGFISVFRPEGTFIKRLETGIEIAYICFSKRGEIILSNTKAGSVVILDRNGKVLKMFETKYNCIWGIACDDKDDIYMCCSDWNMDENHIAVYGKDGTLLREFGQEDVSRALYIALHDDLVYVTDQAKNAVMVFKKDGELVRTFTERICVGLRKPSGIAIDQNGKVVFCDSENKNVKIYDSEFVRVNTLSDAGEFFQDNNAIALGIDGEIVVSDFLKRHIVVLAAVPNDLLE